jgi:glutaredoxin
MSSLHKIAFIFISLFILSAPCLAEVYFYTDDGGRTHFVSSKEKVPAKFRSQLKGQKLAPITKVKSAGYEKQSYGNSYSSAGRVVMYTASWCGSCRRAEKFLKQKKIPYTTYDIEKSKKGKRDYAKLGGGGVPLIKIGSTVMRGFNPNAILTALKK